MTTLTRILKKDFDVEKSNIILFSIGKLISLFGSTIYSFAMSLYVLNATGSGLSFATNLVLGLLPMIVIGPFAGVIADRIDRKKIVVSMDILNGVVLIGVYLLTAYYGLNLILIYCSTLILNILATVFNTSIEAGKPNIVSKDKIFKVNSISKIIDSVSSILGPMVGGLVFILVDIKVFIIVNAISFIFSGVLEMFIDFNVNSVQIKKKSNIDFKKDIRDAFKYMVSVKEIISLFGIFVSVNFFMGLSITIPFPYIITNVLELSSGFYGIIQGFFPVGMIIGSLLIGKITKDISYKKLLNRMIIMLSISIILIGVPLLFNTNLSDVFYLIYYSLILGLVGVIIAIVDIPVLSMLQSMIDDEYRGRVLSLGVSLAKIILPIAYLASGSLMNSMPPYILPIGGGITLIFTMLILNRNEIEA